MRAPRGVKFTAQAAPTQGRFTRGGTRGENAGLIQTRTTPRNRFLRMSMVTLAQPMQYRPIYRIAPKRSTSPESQDEPQTLLRAQKEKE